MWKIKAKVYFFYLKQKNLISFKTLFIIIYLKLKKT